MEKDKLLDELVVSFGHGALKTEQTKDGILTLLASEQIVYELLKHLKFKLVSPFSMLFDLTAIDMRAYTSRGTPPDFTFYIIYHLQSFERNRDLRIKTGLSSDFPSIPSVVSIWASANWYEREVYDMFGIQFTGHPDLRRILMPPNWQGYPL
ncbi:MAG: NADH-quinone oxidoreductase subunit C, partial [Lentimicrobiaceae bacterium]|nr:NADH-quinone oxidoreductase subunit C [Lentimicrobiaceae bacterium]